MADESVFDGSDCDLPPVTPVPTAHMLLNPVVPDPPADIPDCDETPLDPLDEDPPCPPLTISPPTITVVPELEHPPTISFTLTKGDECDYDFDLDIELGCPTGLTPNSIDAQAVPFGTSGLRFAFTKNEDNCDFDLEIDLDVPCPPITPLFAGMTPIPIPFSETPTIQFGFNKGPDCDYELEIDLSAPCPPIMPQTPVEVPVVFAELALPMMAFQFAKGPSCDYELQIEEISVPCPILTPNPAVQKPQVAYGDDADDVGYIEMGFQAKPDCEHELDIEIELPCPRMRPWYDDMEPVQVLLDPDSTPYGELKFGFVYTPGCQWELKIDLKTGCPPVLPLVETPFNTISYAQEGYQITYHFESDEEECKKTFEVTELKLPCLPTPSSTPTITMGAMGTDPEFTAVCTTDAGCQQDWVFTIKVPAGGPQGYQGFQGFQGEQGWQGQQGWQGFQGDMGPQGWQGMDGQQGHQGQQGAQGFQGEQGWQGNQGFQGFQGEQGFQGNQGMAGDKLAIVPYGDRFIGLACVEAGEPRFEEVMTVTFVRGQTRKLVAIDDRYVRACESNSIKAVGTSVDRLLRVAAYIAANAALPGPTLCVMIDPHDEEEVEVTVKLSGLRKGHVWRFREFSAEQYESNLRFWDGWQRQGGLDFSPN